MPESTVLNDEDESALITRILGAEEAGKLPPERDLARHLQIGRSTLRGVLGQLEACGVITRQRRVGTVVNREALQNLRPPVYLGQKDTRQMEPGSARRLRNELAHGFVRECGRKAHDFRLVTVPHQLDHRQALREGRPTVLGGSGVHLPDAIAFGVCADLTERVRGWSKAGDFWPNLWEAASLQGRLYGIPSSAHIYLLIGNRGVLRRQGVTALPETWEQLREAALCLQRDPRCAHGFGLAADHHLAWLFEDLCYQAGGATIEGSGDSWRPQLSSVPVRQATEWLRDLRWEDQTLHLAADSEVLVREVATGTCALAMVECGSLLNQVSWHGYAPEDLVLAPLPAGPGGHRLCQVSILADFINAGAPEEEQEAAWQWLTMWHTPDLHGQLASRFWQNRLVVGWPSVFRQISYRESGCGLPAAWFHLIQDIVARAKPQPVGHGWDLEIFLQPVLRRILADASSDPGHELIQAQRLVRPGMRFLH